ncbi:MAG: hypothetical protein WAX77_10915 [Methylococcaceae bacterium]
MSKIPCLLVLSSCSLISPAVFAKDNPLVRLFNNAEYELNSAVTGYFNKVASSQADNHTMAFNSRLTAKSKVSVSDTMSFGMELYANYSTQKQEYYGAFSSPDNTLRQAPIIDFNSAWLRYANDNVELSAGKDCVQTGLSEIYSPVDIFGRFNLVNPSQMYRLGVWQAGLKYFINDDTLSFKILPVTQRNSIPSQYSRWLGNTNAPEFSALANTYQIEEQNLSVNIENMGYLLNYKGSRAGYDFFGLLYHGASIYPTLNYSNNPTQLIKNESLATAISGGVMKVIEEWKFYGEAIYQRPDNNQDDSFIRYSIGVSYSDSQLANALGFNQINTTLQWSGDETVETSTLLNLALSSKQARPFSNTVLAKIEIEQNNEWGYFFSAIQNVAGDATFIAGAQYKPSDNLSLRLESGFFDGSENSIFGRWQDNDFLRLRTIYKF